MGSKFRFAFSNSKVVRRMSISSGFGFFAFGVLIFLLPEIFAYLVASILMLIGVALIFGAIFANNSNKQATYKSYENTEESHWEEVKRE